MAEARRQAEPQNNQALLDRRLAYLLLRLTLGINILFHGAVRLPVLDAFAEGTVQPFLETAIGLLLIVGLWTRWALVAGALLIAALVFGTALRSDWETLSIQMI